ncbi:endonuclease, partial [Shewanella sp.]
VSDWERRRNNRVYEWQHNRNPFIDNPDWANTLFSSSCN